MRKGDPAADAAAHAEPGAPPSGAEDGRLVRAARAGDGDAFERLVRRHLSVAHGVALSVLRDPHDAEDAVQDAFLAALERLDDLEDPERFRSWLLAIVRNGALNRRSYLKVRDAAPLEAAAHAASGSDPARDAEVAESHGRLAAALEALTAPQRTALLLHDYEGWKHAEIGARLGISAGASRYHLFAARRKLREILTVENGGES